MLKDNLSKNHDQLREIRKRSMFYLVRRALDKVALGSPKPMSKPKPSGLLPKEKRPTKGISIQSGSNIWHALETCHASRFSSQNSQPIPEMKKNLMFHYLMYEKLDPRCTTPTAHLCMKTM